jgi:hypothetical protein
MFDTALRRGAGWQAAHEDLLRLARTRAGLDFEEGEKLRIAERARVHERLGYGSFVEYIERLFGYSPRLTLEKLRVAQALDGLPELAAALREGNVSWSSVRELTRVATPGTERDWLEASRGRTMREIERLVSGHRPGDLPSDAKCRGTGPEICRAMLKTGAWSDMFYASKSRRRCWRAFAKPKPSCAAMRADRSMTTRRCC